MTLTPEEIKKLFTPSKYELNAMRQVTKGTSKKKGSTLTTEVKNKLFDAFGLVFKSRSVDRIAAYGVGKFIIEATDTLLGSKEIVSHIRELQEITKQIKVLTEKRDEIEKELDKLEYCDEFEADISAQENKEKKLLDDMGLTPTQDCGGDSFLRFFLLSFMESKTPVPVKKYSDLNNTERAKYVDALERRISELEAKS